VTLQSSGSISAGDVNVELGRAAAAPFSMDGAAERALAVKPSGVYSMSDFYGKGSAPAPPSGTAALTDTAAANTVAGTATFAGVSIGVAHASRYVFLAVRWSCTTDAIDTAITAATVNGVSAVAVVQNIQNGTSTLSNYGCAILRVAVPTGTSVTVTISFANGTVRRCYIAAFRVLGLISTVATDTASAFDETVGAGTASAQSTINVAANGIVFLASVASAGTSVGAITPTGPTEREDIAGTADDRLGAAMSFGLSLTNNWPVGAASAVNPTGRIRVCAASFRLAP
jgi:hypothetical protein